MIVGLNGLHHRHTVDDAPHARKLRVSGYLPWLAHWWDSVHSPSGCGAEGGIRTRTSGCSQPPEDCVSANFTTSGRPGSGGRNRTCGQGLMSPLLYL